MTKAVNTRRWTLAVCIECETTRVMPYRSDPKLRVCGHCEAGSKPGHLPGRKQIQVLEIREGEAM